MAEVGTDVNKAGKMLLEGKLVAIPTETVYGLAANALDEAAVLSIFKAKQRPFFDPLIIHVHALEAVSNYAALEDERLIALAVKFWPGPLTLLLPKKENIPSIVTSGLREVAVRIPRHPLTLQLLRTINIPLAAPSANPFGYVSPTKPEHVQKQLGDKTDYILDGGDCVVGIESTIVGVEEGGLCIYRLGGLAVEAIEKVAGRVSLRVNMSSDPKAPGQLKNHYAPTKKLVLVSAEEAQIISTVRKVAFICFGKQKIPFNKNFIEFNLSPHADINEAALNLFNFMRRADESDAEVVAGQLVPEDGLGKAINDRLKRAAV